MALKKSKMGTDKEELYQDLKVLEPAFPIKRLRFLEHLVRMERSQLNIQTVEYIRPFSSLIGYTKLDEEITLAYDCVDRKTYRRNKISTFSAQRRREISGRRTGRRHTVRNEGILAEKEKKLYIEPDNTKRANLLNTLLKVVIK